MNTVNGNQDRDGVPRTITDEQWESIQRRAIKANPALNSVSTPEAVKRQRDGGLQHDKRQWS